MAFIKNISSVLPDKELIDQYKRSKDLAVLGGLYQRYMELVYGVCLKYLKEPENAKDAVINIFEELVGKLKKHDVDNFKSWLYQLAKNHCLMQLRSSKGKTHVYVDAAFMQSEENLHLNGELEKEENFKQLEYCLGQLISEQRKVIELFYLQGKCYKQVSEETGIEWNKIRSYIQNGRRNLKMCMEKKNIHFTV